MTFEHDTHAFTYVRSEQKRTEHWIFPQLGNVEAETVEFGALAKEHMQPLSTTMMLVQS